MILTLNQLEKASPYTHYKRLELILPYLNYTFTKYDISSNIRVSHFLAQLLVESNYFRSLQELSSGKEYEASTELGNTEVGDGRRFLGRGYLKIIGRHQYTEYAKHSKVDILTYPHYVTTPKIALDISGWIWEKKKLNLLADSEDLQGITKILTGGYVMIREREEALKKTKEAIGLI